MGRVPEAVQWSGATSTASRGAPSAVPGGGVGHQVYEPGGDADDWVAIAAGPLPVGRATDWAVRPDCGAVVTFSGTARDHAEGRTGVTGLVYEAYEEQVVPRMAAIAVEARARWDVGRLVLLHRVGPVAVGESSVVVVASSAHREEAFAAARFAIDRLKATVPIWKRERWDDGDDWGQGAVPIAEMTALRTATSRPIPESAG